MKHANAVCDPLAMLLNAESPLHVHQEHVLLDRPVYDMDTSFTHILIEFVNFQIMKWAGRCKHSSIDNSDQT